MNETLDPELLKILACPACKGTLDYDKARPALGCLKCRKEYPIEDGIPVLLIEEARPLPAK